MRRPDTVTQGVGEGRGCVPVPTRNTCPWPNSSCQAATAAPRLASPGEPDGYASGDLSWSGELGGLRGPRRDAGGFPTAWLLAPSDLQAQPRGSLRTGGCQPSLVGTRVPQPVLAVSPGLGERCWPPPPTATAALSMI